MDPLFAFVFFGLFSPGPNVILLTASGARFGFRRTLPHVAGVAVGVGITAGLTAFGLGAFLLAVPELKLALQVLAAGWILWMAWRLLRAGRAAVRSQTDRPFTLLQAALFQWVNPKVWAIAVAASAGFPAGLSPFNEAMRMGAAFSSINLGVCLFWSFAGSLLIYLLSSPRAWRVFNTSMAAALALSAGLVFL